MPSVINFNCPNCSAPLSNLKEAAGKCEYCGTPYLIEGIQSYENTLKTENIKSGVSFSADLSLFHRSIIDYLTAEPTAPLDILENVEVEEVVPLVIPSYYYHYNGTSDFMCDIGNDNVKHISSKDGGVQSVSETTWSTITGNTRAEAQGIIAGNSEYDQIIETMYTPYRVGCLTDVESLIIPFNAVTLKYTRPSSSLLDEFIRPAMMNALEMSAVKQLGNRKNRNMTLGNSNIESDREIEKVFVGVYRITLVYHQTKFLLFYSANGEKYIYCTSSPTDPERYNKYSNLSTASNKLSNKKGFMIAIIVTSIILGLILLHTVIVPILAVAAIVYAVRKISDLNPKIDELSKMMADERELISQIKNEFISQNRCLKGFEKYI